jgi:hypothetical protein
MISLMDLVALLVIVLLSVVFCKSGFCKAKLARATLSELFYLLPFFLSLVTVFLVLWLLGGQQAWVNVGQHTPVIFLMTVFLKSYYSSIVLLTMTHVSFCYRCRA